MNCDQTRQLVSAYSDQELTGQQMLEIQAHLQLCPACAREWREINDVRRLLRALASPAPPRSAEEKLAARLKCEEVMTLAGWPMPALNRVPALWEEMLPQGTRPPSRRTAYAFALASVVLLAVAVPFAPSTGDAAGASSLSNLSRPPAPDPPTQDTVQFGTMPPLRLAGTANAIEADPFHDDAIGGYVQGDATMAGFQVSNNGAR